MTELEPLATLLRQELGSPPEAWQHAQRVRLREALVTKRQRFASWRYAPLLAAGLAAAAALGWTSLREHPSARVERVLVAAERHEPFRFEDGSSITVARGGHGRLVADAAFVRFDLQGGRATFDVTPGQHRTWTITAGNNEVTVIGTRFSVAYEPSRAFEVEVERGVVSVRVPERSASVELKAGDRLSGHPGRMEVAHRTTAAPPPAPANLEPESDREEPAPPVQSSRAEPAAETSANDEWRARYRDGKYAESLALLRASGVTERLHELGPRALAEVADAARLGGAPDLAVRALTVLMRRFPGAAEARDGQFLLGRVHALRGDGGAAVSAFEEYLKTNASARYANEAIGRLMELYSARGDHDRARAMARRYLESSPDGPYRRLARSLAAPSK